MMKNKNGMVLEIKKNSVNIITADGEFAEIKINKKTDLPIIGGEYCGELVNTSLDFLGKFRYVTAACLLFFILSFGGGVYAYYTPVSTVTISINPAVEFKLNRWSRILSSHALNSDGEKILNQIDYKNKKIDAALVTMIDQAKVDKFIDDSYVNSGHVISVNISGNNVALPKLQEKLSSDKLNAKIDDNGKTIYNKASNGHENTNKVSDKKELNETDKKNTPTEHGNEKNTKNNLDMNNKNHDVENNSLKNSNVESNEKQNTNSGSSDKKSTNNNNKTLTNKNNQNNNNKDNGNGKNKEN